MILQLREVFQELCTDPTFSVPFAKYPPAENAPLNTRVMDVYDAASRSTYDIIGEIAIDHRFDSLGKPDGHGGDLFEKYVHMQQVVPGSQGFRQEISALYPALDKIWVGPLSQGRMEVLTAVVW